ncbi:efflux RND transporter periplasmic adaptor subunit [Bacteroides salyersiae]|uniref:efflux RND transporter periplasmic adaptor subunit n=1 Tax=Bacteroides salyersiae TaxID=291644 RepID=UPI001C8C0E4F|nr:efflux RND transporter periplasmic adaptor subunit [Bacteroides salyersiae]
MKSRIVLFAFCLTLLSSCGKKGFDMGGAPECAVQTLQPATVNLTSSYPATIKGKQDVEIRPQVSGFITKVCVDEGSMVRKGQVLFIIDPTQYEAAARSAKAAVATAEAAVSTQQITVDNKRALNKKNIISDYDLAMAENSLASAKAQLASAKAQLISAEQNLGFTNVKSPSDGIVNNIPYRLGSLVSPSIATPLTIVSDITEMYVYASLTEKELLELVRKDGSQSAAVETYPEVQLQLSDGSTYDQKGKIETISGVINANTGAVSIRATFPNSNHLLRSGGMGNLIIPYHMENALVVPQKATTEIQDKKFVFLQQPDNTVKMNEITILNIDNGQEYVVTSGLKQGDLIVIENVGTLKDGQTIKPTTPAQSEANFQQAMQDRKEGKM